MESRIGAGKKKEVPTARAYGPCGSLRSEAVDELPNELNTPIIHPLSSGR